jgi:hypothetical protein
MKTIKFFSLFIVLALLLSSCVVKSLRAFYTKDILYFESKFIGKWMDSEKANWIISSCADSLLKENQKSKPSELDADDLKLYNEYKEGYVVNFKKDSTETTYLAMPFKINNQLFLDFIPVEDREFNDYDNNLYKMHLISIHTLAKVDIESDSAISIKWLAQSKLEALLKENKIKIKYETVGVDETILLTASSEELVKFIEKYMASEDEDKWKTDVELNLKRIDD